MMNDYFSHEGELLAALRLTIEGAAILFETDAQPIACLLMDANEPQAYAAFDTLGAALTTLRTTIRALQAEHAKEVQRQLRA